MLADRVAQVFYVLDPETGKHIVIFGKQKIVGIDNVKDNEHQAHRKRLCQESFALYAKRWQRKICMI